jgi:hypothetical protein
MPFDRDLRNLMTALEKAALPPADAVRRRLKARDQLRQFEDNREMAERHVREGEERVERQRDIVLSLKAQGRDSELAESLLSQFEDILAAHKVNLRRFSGR